MVSITLIVHKLNLRSRENIAVPNVYEINKLNNVLALVTKALTTQKTARVTLAIVHQPTEQTPIRNISYIRQEMTTAHVR